MSLFKTCMGKRLGQHFLTNTAIAQRIVDAAVIEPGDTVLEIGPGTGMLTQFLVEKAKCVVAIEKDKNLVIFLKNKFKNIKHIEIVGKDILKYKYNDIGCRYIVVANLPYYITSRFLRLYLEKTSHKPRSMTLMIQKEVAERICAKPPYMNLLGLSVQAFGTPKVLFRVGKGNFSPPPDVESSVIQISNISDEFFTKHCISPEEFFKLPKKAFSQKRKMLRSSINAQHTVFGTKRPQELELEEWIAIMEQNTRHQVPRTKK